MFDPLTMFTVGTTLFNMYAQHEAGRERSRRTIDDQNFQIREREAIAAGDTQRVKEQTAEYAELASYKIDMHRQAQVYNRQQTGYNLLNSGIGISPHDSAGLLLRHQAYMDEMDARAYEAELYYKRPREGVNENLLNLQTDRARRNIRAVRSNEPFRDIGMLAGGAFDIARIMQMSGGIK